MGRPLSKVAHAETKHLLAANLRALIRHRKLTQNALSKVCTVSQKQVNNLARAKTDCGLDVLTELARALGVEPWQLLHPETPKAIGRTSRLARLVTDYVRAAEPDEA